MERVSGDAFIIRRVSPPRPDMDFVTRKSESRMRATSAALFLREGEKGLSCSQLAITSPRQLLAQIDASLADGWEVAIWKVAEISAEYFEVIKTPSNPPELDPGHCEIRATSTFSQKLVSKLAKASTILTQKEIETLRAGDVPVGITSA